MGKVMILSFSEDEEEVCQRMLQIISESPRFEGCNVLQVEKHLSIGEMKLNLAEKNVVILSDGKLMETQTANYFSDIYPIDCAVLSANAQSCQKCCTLLSVLFCA